MRKNHFTALAGFALLVLSAGTMQAGTVTYSSRSAFNAATSGVSTQTFAGVAANEGVGLGSGGAVVSCPLDNSTNSAVLNGLEIDAPSYAGDYIAVFPPNFDSTGLTNYSVFGSVEQAIDFTFAPGVTAASLDVLSLFGSSDVSISAYDTSDLLLGTFTASGAPNTGSGEFWGITSSGDTIGSLDITAGSGDYVGADQVQFGSAGSPAPAVPEPSSVWLFASGLVAACGAFRRRITT
jgi:hypothetical protein